ncbi:MAG: carbamoyltransferase family protein [Brevinematia bacterium]
MLKILGISAFYHDSAAALVIDGDIVAAAQEERFTRKKGDADFPINAINYCLKEGGLEVNQLDAIVFYDKPIVKFERIIASYIHRAPAGLRSFLQAIPIWLKSKLWTEDEIKRRLGYKKEIFFTSHHQSHAASAFFPSPFEEAAILTVDGVGEWDTTTIGYGRQNQITLLKKICFPHSLGLLYSAFTYYCGFKVNSGEYKLMGLAPYGKPVYLDLIKGELIKIAPDGSYLINEKFFDYISGLKMINKKFEKLFGRKALNPDETPDQFYMNIAASIQALFNEIMVLIAKEAKRITSLDNLTIAGGVGLNCVSNSHILREAEFKDVWVQPAAGDAGGALGAALYAYYSYFKKPRKIINKKDFQKSSYLGPQFDDNEIEKTLLKYNAKYHILPVDRLIKEVAEQIAKQKVVGFFRGRMEFGPRALGNRSILGDPRSEDMQSVMNLKIKFRESFRPFAPSVKLERVGDFFEWDRASPYMLFVANVKRELLTNIDTTGRTGLELLKLKRSTLPAITHVDNSARIQTVSYEDNSVFYDLISEFERISGVPVLINTSFNVRGEPIVCTPEDAYLCFMGTNMDILVIENFILYKEEQDKNVELSKWKSTITKD